MQLTDAHLEFLGSSRRFVAEEIAPRAAENDVRESFDLEMFKAMGRSGFFEAPFSENEGGRGLGFPFFYAHVLREVAAACASTAVATMGHTSLCAGTIARYGTPALRERYLRRLMTGQLLGGFALTEINAGSDMSGIETFAEQRGEEYVLRGHKIFITNANLADVFVIAAKTSRDTPAMGTSLFVVERGTRGFSSSGTSPRKLGMRATDTGELHLEDVVVSASQVLGRRGMALPMISQALTGSRLGMAAIALGLSDAAYACCVSHARTREQFGKPIYQFQSVGNMLADMTVGISAAELLLDKAVGAGTKTGALDASVAKLFASETANRITKDAVQMLAGHGYYGSQPVERYYRDAKLTEIADGTSEIQRLLIAEDVIKRASRSPKPA